MKKKVEKIVKQINNQITTKPTVAIILGSGLADFVDAMEDKVVIPYSTLKGMPESKVLGHKNQFIIGNIAGKTVIAMQGRFHPYDGFSAKEVAMPIYIFKLLGVKTLIITNAAGAINLEYDPGDIMLIKSHINLTGMNPLVGGAIIDFGKQFIDLQQCYNKEYLQIVKNIAKKHKFELKEGVYCQMLGPNYETPAEVEMLRTIKVDNVGMSTVLEAIAGCQCEMKILGISCISNKGVTYEIGEELTHEDVLNATKSANNKLKIILPEFLKQID